MEKECMICHTQVSILNHKKLADKNCVCKNCAKGIPSIVRIKNIRKDQFLELYQKRTQKNEYIQKFCETISYGNLHVDERNGLVAICQKKDLDKEGRLKDQISYNIFYCLDIQEIELSFKQKKQNTDYVSGDIILSFMIGNDFIRVKTTVKKNEKYRIIMGEESAFLEEPHVLEFFKSAYNRMCEIFLEKERNEDLIRLEFMRQQEEILRQQGIQRKTELEKAKDAFFLDGDDFTLADIRSHKRKLMKSFHQDNGEKNPVFAQKINHYYEILERYIKERDGDTY